MMTSVSLHSCSASLEGLTNIPELYILFKYYLRYLKIDVQWICNDEFHPTSW